MFSDLINKRIILLFTSLIVFSGCGIWENFTTYFNLYYNADELFEKSEQQILEQKKELFSTETPTLPGTAAADLQKVIEKCSNILQFSPNSSYVDEALMMLGKAFYYQKSYLKSKQKFEELIATQTESEYLLEAQLWIGKCEMRLRNYPEGLAILGEVRNIAIEEEDDEIIQEAFIEEIVYRKTIEDYSGAIQSANNFLAVSENDDIKADVWYEVGNLNMLIDEVKNAVGAYRNVFEYSPDYELEVAAKIKLGRALREIGEHEEALALFEDMRSEDKYSEKYSDLDLEIGITQSVLGNYDEAVTQLTIVDTTYKNSQNAGVAKYELASVYETGLKQLDSAAVYYQKAATSTLPPDYIVQAKEKNRIFTRYTSLRNDQNKYGKQLFYLLNPDEFKKDSAQYVQDSLAIAEEIAEVKELQEIWAGLDTLMRGKQDTTGYYQDSLKVADTLITILQDSLEYINRDSVFSWVRNPIYADSMITQQFDSMFTNRTFDPNAKMILEQRRREQESFTNQLVASLPDTLKFKNNPPKRPKISEDSLKTLLAKNQLDLGNLFLSELNFPDSAYWYYDINISEYANTPYYPNSLFALGSYYLTVDNKDKADSLFHIIYENYKNESIVNAAADMLNKPFIDLNYDPALDEYEKAEEHLLAGEYYTALNKLETIPVLYPASDVAPKAIYTAGWIEENELKNYSAAIEFYDTLIARYPASEYVKVVAPKVTFYKQEKRKQEMALHDSLQAITHSDSLISDTLIVIEEEVLPQDTVQVAVTDEEQIPGQNGQQIVGEKPKDQGIREPIWNPRKRK